ncbi:MAG: NAD(P)-binding domain-containing protein [Rhodothermales bacterium]
MKTNIGILGSGTVGKTLAAGFLQHGHDVMIGSRTPAKLSDWAAQHPGVRVGTFDEVAAFGDLVVLATKGTAAEAALTAAGAANLKGKTIADATNPIAEKPPTHGVLSFFTTLDDSLMERLQRAFPEAHFVKAFSCVGAALMVDPQLESRPTMFICGNDAGAKTEVTGILDAFGWDAEDMGPVEAARAIEPLCILWCIPGFVRNDWAHAFKVLR